MPKKQGNTAQFQIRKTKNTLWNLGRCNRQHTRCIAIPDELEQQKSHKDNVHISSIDIFKSFSTRQDAD
jgi:hypothetical protein